MSSVARLSVEDWKVHSRAPIRAADRAVQWLYEHGVRRVFGIPGGTISPLYDALVTSDIEVVVCQHEAMAAYLASGEALETGRPGVVAVTSGPGILNTVTSVAAAFHDEIPLLVLAGEVRTDWRGRGALQDGSAYGLDIRRVFAPVTRFQDELTQPERMDELLGRAWAAAREHPRGPALLRIPVDIGSSAVGSVPEWRSPARVQRVDVAGVEAAARLLSEASRPAILVGVGARSTHAGRAIERLAYRLRAPVMSDIEGKSVVPDTERLYVGQLGLGQYPSVSRLLDEGVDVLVSVGARLDDTATLGFDERVRPSRGLIQIDHDPHRMGRAWRADVELLGDVRATCEMLVDAVEPLAVEAVFERRVRIEGLTEEPRPAVPALAQAPFDPRSVVAAMREAWPDATFFTDIGNHLLFAAEHVDSRRSGDFHASVGLAGMGCGIGAAMGMAAARGIEGEAVVCICGDGGLLMVGSELATAAKYQIPVVLCVFDDGRHGMVQMGMEAQYGRAAFSVLPDVLLVDYARSLGVDVVDVASPDDLRPPPGPRRPLVLRVPVDRSVRPTNPRVRGFCGESDAPGA